MQTYLLAMKYVHRIFTNNNMLTEGVIVGFGHCVGIGVEHNTCTCFVLGRCECSHGREKVVFIPLEIQHTHTLFFSAIAFRFQEYIFN